MHFGSPVTMLLPVSILSILSTTCRGFIFHSGKK